MKIIEREINDLHTVKTEEEMEFYPGHQADLLQLEVELLDISNGDIKDLLAIEETDLVKSENLKVENEMQADLLQLEEELLDISIGDIEKDLLAIEDTDLVKSENLKVDNEMVTVKGSTKRCKRSINNFMRDGIIKKNFSECKCAYGDVTTEVENISSKNKLPIQKGKKSVCECCDERFRCKFYLKKHINFTVKRENKELFSKVSHS
ncbi:uncharacterized protein LOC142333913 [Lycorma delicatula]|uniref:uncharacterized protein LOC142333913 n=1 Tax=Lycorma delicatula TaxID=130591 RepID=UPI003F5109D9